MRRWLAAFGLIASLVGVPFLTTAPALAFGSDGNNSPLDCIYFPETGHNICDTFHEWWVGWGDLATYGYPISEAYIDPNTGLITQWLERARLEWHPNADPAHFNVLLGLLGNEVAKRVPNQQPFQAAGKRGGSGCTYFDATKHNLCGGFYSYWKKFGALSAFGYPTSEEFTENGLTVQYFERERFEWHPGEWPSHFDVMLGLLGSQLHGVEPKVASKQPARPIGDHAPGWGITCRFYTSQYRAQIDYYSNSTAFAGLDPNYNGIACDEGLPGDPPATHASNVGQAISFAAQQGYPYCDSKGYQQSASLSVLICSNGGNTYVRLFFFHLGTLLPVPTGGANITFAWSSGNTVALNYPIWHNAPHCCPTGNATVRFRWNGSKLVLLDPIPDQLQ